ncbi:hypothetical protein [Streptomyces sp. NPDC002521]
MAAVKGFGRTACAGVTMWAVVGALLVAGGLGLWTWEPKKDRSPFTATVGGVSPLAERADAGEVCTPKLAGQAVVIYDASGKRELASGVEPSEGEVLPSSDGDTVGWYFHATQVQQLPGGEGTYKVQIGGGNIVTIDEDQLRTSIAQQREAMRNRTPLSNEDV